MDICLIFSTVILLHKVSEVPVLLLNNNICLFIGSNSKSLPTDLLHCFNFFTISRRIEYLKPLEVVPEYSNIKRPIYLTSGCNNNLHMYICVQYTYE